MPSHPKRPSAARPASGSPAPDAPAVPATLTAEPAAPDAPRAATGRRPGEGDVLATRAGAAIERYSDDPPVTGDEGAIDEMCLYAGEGCGAIEDLPPVAELLERLAG